jgi:hypothetical protein
MRLMAAISPIAAPAPAPNADAHQQKGATAAVDFGGAVTHRELVREKLRVDPASLANKKMASENVRPREYPPERPEREEEDDSKGQYLDISV